MEKLGEGVRRRGYKEDGRCGGVVEMLSKTIFEFLDMNRVVKNMY